MEPIWMLYLNRDDTTRRRGPDGMSFINALASDNQQLRGNVSDHLSLFERFRATRIGCRLWAMYLVLQ